MSLTSKNSPSIISWFIPVLLQSLVVAAIVGWLTYQSTRTSVSIQAFKVRSEILSGIVQHLNSYLEKPHLINRINKQAMYSQRLNNLDLPSMETYFTTQIQIFEDVSFIYYGDKTGGIVGAGRSEDGNFEYIIADKSTNANYEIYDFDVMGEKSPLKNSLPDYDATTRPWYQAPVKKGGGTWSEVYKYLDRPTLAITAGLPIYDKPDEIQGVTACDLTLDRVKKYLVKIKSGTSGEIFIVERDGKLIATSSDEEPYIITGNETRRLTPHESKNPLIKATAGFLKSKFNDISNIKSNQQLHFNMDGKEQFVEINRYLDPMGLDWLIVLVMPEDDFMQNVREAVSMSVGVALLALLLADLLALGLYNLLAGQRRN